jgi:hypothetical protein
MSRAIVIRTKREKEISTFPYSEKLSSAINLPSLLKA